MTGVGIRWRAMAIFGIGVLWAAAGACEQEQPEAPQEEFVRGYHSDVAPILAEHCQTCHVEDSIAPIAFHTYEDAANIAPILKQVVVSRTMPPYTVDASGECNSFRDARWLTQEEIDTVANWVDSGAPEGTYVEPPEPTWAKDSLKEVDAVALMEEPYTWDDPNMVEDYRCFVVDPEVEEDSYVVGFNVVPGQHKQVHHV
ncbi:MAG: hypothetical protein VX938_00870, partial [Myxococcota bacterium]|nr:hypothetical protein [Myxococcota bacterium]